jgi:hypothetical protein
VRPPPVVTAPHARGSRLSTHHSGALGGGRGGPLPPSHVRGLAGQVSIRRSRHDVSFCFPPVRGEPGARPVAFSRVTLPSQASRVWAGRRGVCGRTGEAGRAGGWVGQVCVRGRPRGGWVGGSSVWARPAARRAGATARPASLPCAPWAASLPLRPSRAPRRPLPRARRRFLRQHHTYKWGRTNLAPPG